MCLRLVVGCVCVRACKCVHVCARRARLSVCCVNVFLSACPTTCTSYMSRSFDAGTSWTVPTPALQAADTKTSLWSFGGLTSGLLLSYVASPV
jgi:hypothetical protein